VSGRLSSSDPNLQNIPTPEKEPGTVLANLPVKNIFTASHWGNVIEVDRQMYGELLGPHVEKGGLILAADYSGMELRTMASVSGCKKMMEIFARGEDVHRIVSSGIFNVPVDQVTKEMRYRGKWTNWTLLYGGSEYTFQRLYGIPLDEGKRFVQVYYDLFPEILEYQEETKQFARDHGYVDSKFGQRRFLPYINDRDGGRRSKAEREAVNHPIQSVASQMLLMVLIILDEALSVNQLRTKMVNTVHDSIMFDVPFAEVPVVAGLVKRVMEDLKDMYKDWFPHMDLSWFTCPLVADLEIGSHYGSLHEHHIIQEQ
jgi:DNA polymerase-1